MGEDKLGFLDSQCRIILKEHDGQILPDMISESLEVNFGATILSNPPKYISHPQLTRFLYTPTAQRILQFLLGSQKPLLKVFGKMDAKLKDSWREFLTTAHHNLSETEIAAIKQLKIFRARNETGLDVEFFTDLTAANLKIEPLEIVQDCPPDGITFAKTLICQSSSNLAGKVGLKTLSWSDFLLSIIEAKVFSSFTSHQRTLIIDWLLPSKERFYHLSDQVRTALRSLKCIPCGNDDVLEAPSTLFDPANDKVRVLFLLEPKFPAGRYAKAPLLNVLKELCLKVEPEVDDVIRSAEIVNTWTEDKNSMPDLTIIKSKAKAIRYWLGQLRLTSGHLEQLRELRFVEVVQVRHF